MPRPDVWYVAMLHRQLAPAHIIVHEDVGLSSDAKEAIAFAVLVATMISGLYPAWRAGKVVPVESIRLV